MVPFPSPIAATPAAPVASPTPFGAPIPVEPEPATAAAVGFVPFDTAFDEPRRSKRGIVVLGVAAALLLLVGSLVWLPLGDDTPEPPAPTIASGPEQPRSLASNAAPIEPDPDPEPDPNVQPKPESESEPELLAVADATPIVGEPSLDPPRRNRRTRKRRRRSRSTPAPTVESKPEPKPPKPKPKPKPPSPADLLRQAKSALARGDAARAYRLAARSNQGQRSAEASSVMARAACRTGQTDRAKQALKAVPRRDRSSIRRDCRQNGTRIGV
ncbi:MAG: hypothetical protein AAGF11_11080 [Myxococcota bacterium]